MEFVRASVGEDFLMSWERLRESIPERLRAELVKMGILE